MTTFQDPLGLSDEGTPNLDVMTDGELTAAEAAFAHLEQQDPSELEPIRAMLIRTQGEDVPVLELQRAMGLLTEYAKLARAARVLRLGGQIGRAITVEAICERLYDSLPKALRW